MIKEVKPLKAWGIVVPATRGNPWIIPSSVRHTRKESQESASPQTWQWLKKKRGAKCVKVVVIVEHPSTKGGDR